MQHTEDPFPQDHPLKGEMQENNLRQRLDPQPQPQPDKQQQQGDEEQLLKHRQSPHQLSEHHVHHVQEISKHPHVTADSSRRREDGFRQMTGRERISINKDLIGTPSNFQHIGHINREVTSTQTTEEVRNLFQMVNLYQEQVGLLPGKVTEEEPVECSGSEGVNRRVDIPLAGDPGFADTEQGAAGITEPEDHREVPPRQSPAFEDALDLDLTDYEEVDLRNNRKERLGIPSASEYRTAHNFDPQRPAQTPQQTDQAILLHDRVKLQEDFGEEDRKGKKNTRKSLSPCLLGSSSSLTREGKLRKEMIGSPKDFQHVMGAGHMLESHEKKSALAVPHPKKEETEGRGAKEPSHDRVIHIRKDMIGQPTDFQHVMGASQMLAAHEIPPTHTPPNATTSETEGREEQKDLPYYRRPQPSAPPPPPPSALPPSSARIKGGRLRKDMIGAPTNFHHVMGTAPYHASFDGPATEEENEQKSRLEERVAFSARLGQENSEATKPIRKKSSISHPTNFQHVIHVDTSTPESDLKQLLIEKTSDASVHGSAHDVSKVPAGRGGGARQGAEGRGGSSATRPSAHAKIRKDMIGTPTNFQHISHAGIDLGKA